MKVADANVLRHYHLAAVHFGIPADQVEERALARAVRAHHTDALPRIDAERHLSQHLLRPEALAHLDKIDHGFTKGSTRYRTPRS